MLRTVFLRSRHSGSEGEYRGPWIWLDGNLAEAVEAKAKKLQISPDKFVEDVLKRNLDKNEEDAGDRRPNVYQKIDNSTKSYSFFSGNRLLIHIAAKIGAPFGLEPQQTIKAGLAMIALVAAVFVGAIMNAMLS